jgi:hypothetical protein
MLKISINSTDGKDKTITVNIEGKNINVLPYESFFVNSNFNVPDSSLNILIIKVFNGSELNFFNGVIHR